MNSRHYRASFVALLLFAFAPAVRAQNQNPTTSAATVITSVPSSSCDDSKVVAPTATAVVASCTGTSGPGGFTATAGATATAGSQPGAGIQTSAHVNGNVNPFAIADGSASYHQYITSGGAPLSNIFRIMLASAVTLNIDAGGTTAEADMSVGPADSPLNPSILRTSFVTDPGSFSLQNYIYGAELGGGDTFFFMLYAHAGAGTATPGAFNEGASVLFPAPTITLYDQNNVDITTQYTLTYDPDLAPVSAVPEPASLTLLATGLAGVAGAARRKRRQQTET
jgi:hypothetical protein